MNNFMKKVAVILSLVIFSTAFAGCSKSNKEVVVPDEVIEEEKEEKDDKVEDKTDKVEEKIEVKAKEDTDKVEEKLEVKAKKSKDKVEKKVDKVEPVKKEAKTEILENTIGEVTVNSLNIRKEPTTNSKVVGSLSKGNVIILKEYIDTGWYKVVVNEKEAGYVSAQYVTKVKGVERFVTTNITLPSGNILKRGEKVNVIGMKDLSILCKYNGEEFKIENNAVLSLNKPYEKPQVSENKNESNSGEVIGQFTTYFDEGNVGRSQNIRLASKAISVSLEPGQEFIWSQIVGQASESKGYKPAPVFSGNKVVQGIGGGVCQVSTTLYNAVLNANLKVTERHPHSMPVTYIGSGKDAAVAYGSLDFRFINTTNHKITITASANSGALTIKILK